MLSVSNKPIMLSVVMLNVVIVSISDEEEKQLRHIDWHGPSY
jgi:hypothetical protein